MVRGVEKWNNKKYFNFLPFCLIGSEKVKEWIKMSLYKFTHISLLKYDAQLKQKSDKQPKKKKKHLNLFFFKSFYSY